MYGHCLWFCNLPVRFLSLWFCNLPVRFLKCEAFSAFHFILFIHPIFIVIAFMSFMSFMSFISIETSKWHFKYDVYMQITKRDIMSIYAKIQVEIWYNLRVEVWAHKTSLNPPLFIEVPVKLSGRIFVCLWYHLCLTLRFFYWLLELFK